MTARIIRTEPFRSEFEFHAEVDGRLVGYGYVSFEAARAACRKSGFRFDRDGEPEFVTVRFLDEALNERRRRCSSSCHTTG